MNKLLTLCIVQQEDKVLLGYKKRGFGMGRWNGFGGKVLPGESIRDAAIRETSEEACITPTDLVKLGILEFSFINDPEVLEVHVFKASHYEGEVGESEEMLPRWYPISDIPYGEMWKDDIFWFPYFLQDTKFKGRFVFDADDAICEHTLKEVIELS